MSQYQQLERLYRVQVSAENMHGAGQDHRALRKTSKACAAVNDSDPLLATVVAGCEEVAELATSAVDLRCNESQRCLTVFRLTARKIDRLLDTARQAQRTATRLLADADCRQALAPPPEFYLAFEMLSRGLRDMAAAIETGDKALAGNATDRLSQSERHLEDVPSANALLDRFRERCAA